MRFLVTAGPTRESLDPVRHLSNRSSGRLGIACAAAARDAGHEVVLVLGPTHLEPPAEVTVARVESAHEMAEAVAARRNDVDVFVFTAAVADWTPLDRNPHKARKSDAGDRLRLDLVRTRDIFAETGSARRPGQVLAGFCLETRDHVARATAKLEGKNGDVIIANDAATLGSETIEPWWIDRAGTVEALGPMSKSDFAECLVTRLASRHAGAAGAVG